jgi:hypothetical protein
MERFLMTNECSKCKTPLRRDEGSGQSITGLGKFYRYSCSCGATTDKYYDQGFNGSFEQWNQRFGNGQGYKAWANSFHR